MITEHRRASFTCISLFIKNYVFFITLVDGNGILHHRGCGLATHLGVLANIPTVGTADVRGKGGVCRLQFFFF